MKKSSIVKIISLAIILIACWYYLMQRFENFVNKDLISYLEENKEFFSYDALEINKYTFKATFKGLKINAPYLLKFDEITIRHIPIIDATRYSLNKVYVIDRETQQNLLYATANNYVAWETTPLMNQDPLNWSITSSYENLALYDGETNAKIVAITAGKNKISHTVKNGNQVSLDVNSISQTTLNNPRLISKVIELFMLALKEENNESKDLSEKFLKEKNFINEIQEAYYSTILPYSEEYTIHIQYDQKLYDMVEECMNSDNKQNIKNELITIFKNSLIVNATYNQKTPYFHHNFDLNLNNAIESHNFNINYAYKAIHGEEFANLINGKYCPILNKKLEQDALATITSEECSNFLKPLLEMKNFTFKLELNELKKDTNYSGIFDITLDEHNFSINGEFSKDGFSGNVFLTDVNKASSDLLTYLNNGFLPACFKMKNLKTPNIDFTELKEASYKAFKSLDQDDKTKDLELKIKFSTKEGGTINNKDIISILLEPQVLDFNNKLSEITRKILAELGKKEELYKESNKK